MAPKWTVNGVQTALSAAAIGFCEKANFLISCFGNLPPRRDRCCQLRVSLAVSFRPSERHGASRDKILSAFVAPSRTLRGPLTDQTD